MNRRSPRTASLLRTGLSLAIATVCACATTHDSPEDEAAKTSIPDSAASDDAAIDAVNLERDVSFLSSDALMGRHTLSPSLREAADYLSTRYAEVGLTPLFGDDFRVPFSLPTGASATDATAVTITDSNRDIPVDRIAPSALGRAGDARGDLVFVGYGLVSNGDADTPNAASSRPPYDDFDGLDVEGKIVVVLEGIPGMPDMNALSRRVTEIAETYAREVAPLLERGDSRAALRLHAKAVSEVGKLASRALRGASLPAGFDDPPDEAPTTLELGRRMLPVMKAFEELPGPAFEFWRATNRAKVRDLHERGAAGVILVKGPRSLLDPGDHAVFPTLDDESSVRGPVDLPVLHMSWKEADRLVKVGRARLSDLQARIDDSLQPASGEVRGTELTINAGIERSFTKVPNLAGVLLGSERPDEFIVVGGHYDHIGTADDGHGMCRTTKRKGVEDTICNGADDNASGSSVVLAVADAFRRSGLRPRRSIIFAHFAGEELGLLGSRALVGRDDFPTDDIRAMINLDMVGRASSHGIAIGGIKSSPTWMPMLDEVGTFGAKTIYESEVAGRSDHANFYTRGVPVLFFFTGLHAAYHRASDNLDQLDLEGMYTVARMVFEVVRRAADGRPLPYVAPTEGDGIASALPGTNPETILKVVEAEASSAP